MSTIGARLKAAREVAELTQGELAIRCGWGDNVLEAQSRISNYERNEREPTLSDVVKLATALGVDPAELAFGHPLRPDPDEEMIIRNYRRADDRGKTFIVSSSASAAPQNRKRRYRRE